MAGRREDSVGKKTLANRRTPSRMGTGTLRYLTTGFCAASARYAHEARIRYSLRTTEPNTAFLLGPPGGLLRCARPPEGRWHGPPLRLMLAKPCGEGASPVRRCRRECARM